MVWACKGCGTDRGDVSVTVKDGEDVGECDEETGEYSDEKGRYGNEKCGEDTGEGSDGTGRVAVVNGNSIGVLWLERVDGPGCFSTSPQKVREGGTCLQALRFSFLWQCEDDKNDQTPTMAMEEN